MLILRVLGFTTVGSELNDRCISVSINPDSIIALLGSVFSGETNSVISGIAISSALFRISLIIGDKIPDESGDGTAVLISSMPFTLIFSSVRLINFPGERKFSSSKIDLLKSTGKSFSYIPALAVSSKLTIFLKSIGILYNYIDNFPVSSKGLSISYHVSSGLFKLTTVPLTILSIALYSESENEVISTGGYSLANSGI